MTNKCKLEKKWCNGRGWSIKLFYVTSCKKIIDLKTGKDIKYCPNCGKEIEGEDR